MSKIAFVGFTNHKGGIESLMHTLIPKLQGKIKYDQLFILAPHGEIAYEDEYKKLGVEIVEIGSRKDDNYLSNLNSFLPKMNSDDLVYLNITSYCNWSIFEAVKRAKCKVIIHGHQAHLSSILKVPFHTIGQIRFLKLGTKIAVSRMCNSFMFCNRADYIVFNGIPSKKYIFNLPSRKKIRKELNIQDEKIVVGYVGRINEEKNTLEMVNIAKKYPEISFVFVGDYDSNYGKKVLTQASDNCLFVGEKDKVNDYMSSFDALLIPSKYEAFSLVGIEAMTNGLPVYCFKRLYNFYKNDLKTTGTVRCLNNSIIDVEELKKVNQLRNKDEVTFKEYYDESSFVEKIIQIISNL